MAKMKTITSNQILGEIGETAVRGRFLSMGFQFDGRSRLEAGIDGIVEVMLNGQHLQKSAQDGSRRRLTVCRVASMAWNSVPPFHSGVRSHQD